MNEYIWKVGQFNKNSEIISLVLATAAVVMARPAFQRNF